MAIFVNRSPQRQEVFLSLQSQTNERKVVPIQDVKTRWNSTYLMLKRAKRLQSVFNEFPSHGNCPKLRLSQEEWRQIEYLLCLTQPFFKFTTALSKTKDVTIHSIFILYNRLFDHLDKSIYQLRPKKVPWKQLMLSALKAARQKLRDYYAETDNTPNDLYAIGTMVGPSNKFQFFQTKDWKDYRDGYRKSFEKYFEPYKQRLLDTQSPSKGPSAVGLTSELDMLLVPEESRQSTTSQNDELIRYLTSSKYFIYPDL
jgi:hypothetical protein